jgi:hypothetical protein
VIANEGTGRAVAVDTSLEDMDWCCSDRPGGVGEDWKWSSESVGRIDVMNMGLDGAAMAEAMLGVVCVSWMRLSLLGLDLVRHKLC